MSKISQGNKGEEKVKKVLNSIKEKHIVFNDISFKNEHSEMTHQIDHIVIKSNGVFVIETKNYFGKILVSKDGKNWTKIVGNKIEKISSPVMQNKSHAVTVFKAIRGYVKTVPVVVFVQNNSPYIESENVINLKDLKLFLDTYENDVVLDDNQINEIAKMIKNSSIEITRDEHIFNIKYYKQIIQEREEEMSIAIETNSCPLCGSQMLRKGQLYYCSKCDFRFYL